MGRGQIVNNKGNGLYDVRLVYAYRSRITERLATYTAQMAELDIKIAAETNPNKLALLKLQRASIQKLYDYYSANMPADPTVEAWCADLTEDLTGNVGTIEIPGEQVTVIIRPGYNNRAVYTSARDGQMMPAIAGSPHQVLFNWMLLPGWQRHKPVYRAGTIIDGTIDHDAHTCSVCLDPAYSTQQYLPAVDGLEIGDCGGTNPVLSQVADFCSRNPGHPFCTNTDEGTEINLTDEQLAQLKTVNLYVNQNYGRQGDPSGFKLGDSWDVMAPGGFGDCEDFALTKMQKLVDDYGWSPANLKIVTSYMQDGTGHAFLAVRTSNRGLVALDVNYDNVIDSGKLPYRVDRIALTKDTWKSYTRRIEAAAVEYMTCNSWAFADGDRVVVQFTDQDWTKPKIIGFAESPGPCGQDKFFHMYGGHFRSGYPSPYFGYFSRIFDITGEAWILYEHPINANWDVEYAGGTYFNGKGFVFGGYGGPWDAGTLYLLDSVYSLNPRSLSWTTKQNLPASRSGVCGGYSFSEALCIGGFSGLTGSGGTLTEPYFDTNFGYNETADTWESNIDCPQGKAMVDGFTLNSKFYLPGGEIGAPPLGGDNWAFAEKTRSNFFYDSTTGSFTSRQGMTRETSRDAQVGAAGYGYSFGGWMESGAATFSAIKYNPNGNSWSSIESLIQSGYFAEPLYPAGYNFNDGKIYVGRTQSETSPGPINRYDPNTDAYYNFGHMTDCQNCQGDNSVGFVA